MKGKKTYIDYLALVLLLLLAAACLLSVSLSSNQASLSFPLPLTFRGEYSYDGETWTPLSDDAELSALRGSVILRGRLDVEIGEGSCLNYYRNHIGVSMYINGEPWALDTITEYASMGIGLMPSMCGRVWGSICSPGITPEDELEIHLYNPHAHGNGTAYRDFLNTLCHGPDPVKTEVLQKNLEPYGQPFRIVGGLLIIMALILLGAAMASAFLRIPVGGKLLTMGLLTLFVGGFFIFDTIDVCFWSNLVVLNTYARQLCMMLAVSCLGYCLCHVLTGKRRQVTRTAVLISVLLNAVLIVLSFTGIAVIYDTYFYWAASQWLCAPCWRPAVFCSFTAQERKTPWCWYREFCCAPPYCWILPVLAQASSPMEPVPRECSACSAWYILLRHANALWPITGLLPGCRSWNRSCRTAGSPSCSASSSPTSCLMY